MQRTTDFILLQTTLDSTAVAGLAPAAQGWCAASPLPMALHRVAWPADTQTAYVYARLSTRTSVDSSVLATLAAAFGKALAGATHIHASRLETVMDLPGASHTDTPLFHYVVETNAEEGWMPEIARWYDTEHMPGLARVPGCIRATRLLNHDHGPQSLACYDLVSTQILGSAPWLAVRNTAWSDIARPHFINTQRTMFNVIA
ncbi:MAG: hypothetical protein WB821_00590 [Burkholderiaceae bacterium]